MEQRPTERVTVLGPECYEPDALATLRERAQRCTHTYFDTTQTTSVIEVGDASTQIIALYLADYTTRAAWLEALDVSDIDEPVLRRGNHTWINRHPSVFGSVA